MGTARGLPSDARVAGRGPFADAHSDQRLQAELRDKDFAAGVRAALTETGLSPCGLELELTETFLIQDSKSIATVLRPLETSACGSRWMTSAPAIRA